MSAGMEMGILTSVLLSLGLGGVIGLERELVDKPAGLRTNMLVAGSSTLLVRLSDLLVGRFEVEVSQSLIRVDPVRVIEAVVTGVSFIAAGTIMRRARESEVEGLTTAATILMSAAIGVCVALSAQWLAVGVTVVVLITLRGVGAIEGWLGRRRSG